MSTSIGAEGLDVRNGRDIILVDEPEAFAESVVTLLREPELRKKYERAAAELVSRFGWSSVAERFAEVLSGAVVGTSRRADSLQATAVNR